MTALDLTLLCLVVLGTLGLGLAGARQDADTDDFLLAGRSLPWWAAGTSMVATTFAVDTPLVVAGLTAQKGLAANWFWWGLLGSHLLVTFGLAARWRATECTTDAEVVTLRYGDGVAARTLRRLRAVYFMVPINLFVLGWVLHAGAKVLGSLIPFAEWVGHDTLAQLALGSLDGASVLGLGCALIIALAYGTVAGLRGVVWTDLLQFSLAMFGAVALAWIAYQSVGSVEGVAQLIEQQRNGLLTPDLSVLAALDPLDASWLELTRSTPTSLDLVGDHADLVIIALLLSWWANKNADGGGILVQRMLACKSPRDATLAMGWFTAAHYMLRPWAWVATGLVVGLLLSVPPGSGFEQSYPDAMLSWLPSGVLGLALGGMVAALVSTADTHLHWGASYLANDLLPARTTDARRLSVSRWAQPVMALTAAVLAVHLESIAAAWKVLLVLGAGLGAPTLLRWFLPRINAQAELNAFGASTLVSALVLWGPWEPLSFAWQMTSVGATGLVACLVTAGRTPSDTQQVDRFMARTQVVPSTWWLFALAALVALLLSAVGAQRALSGAQGGSFLLAAGGVAYVVVLLRYARRIEASPTAACQRRGDQAGRPNAEEPSHD
ncbi:MAG: hypothetical protein VYB65_00320 [Myxococcota bacterium]|nr:hypothetical protein [Myxococcota bacterium]